MESRVQRKLHARFGGGSRKTCTTVDSTRRETLRRLARRPAPTLRSMSGDKAHTAKALALALAWIARQQRRWCGLCAYSGDTGERLLALPPARWDEAALLDWLEAFLGGGSSIDVPVRELPGYWRRLGAPDGDTDVLFITDAICRIPSDVRERFLEWKRQAQARLITLVVEGEPGDLTAISDEVYQVPSLAVTEEAVGRALSL